MQNAKVVSETNVGIYVWEMPNGDWVGDDEGHWMCITSMRGDEKRIAQLTAAARAYGVLEGKPYFVEGAKMVSDEEYEEQRERMMAGEMPDPYDLGNMIEESKKQRGR